MSAPAQQFPPDVTVEEWNRQMLVDIVTGEWLKVIADRVVAEARERTEVKVTISLKTEEDEPPHPYLFILKMIRRERGEQEE